MSAARGGSPYRGDAVARLVAGAALTMRPAATAAALGAGRPSPRVQLLARMLGVRHLAEAVLLTRWPSPGVRRAITGVDTVHAASMVAVAALSPSHRRIATTAALLAGGQAALGWLAARDDSVGVPSDFER